MCPYRYYAVMRINKDKKTLRHQMVVSVETFGIKETARRFHTTRNTVRKWHRRWCEEGYAGLADRSRRPKHSPLVTSPNQRRKLVKLKKKYKRLGAEAIKTIEGLSQSPRTIRKIWRQEGVSSRKPRKKHQTKQNLRAVKKCWALFKQICEDTKAVQSIPGQNHYTIPPDAHRFQAAVETVHNLVEMEFYEIENFKGCQDFLNRVYSYQLFFNLQRPNSYKENKTPWQIAKQKNPKLPKEIATIPPVFLEDLLDKQLESEVRGVTMYIPLPPPRSPGRPGSCIHSGPTDEVGFVCGGKRRKDQIMPARLRSIHSALRRTRMRR